MWVSYFCNTFFTVCSYFN